MPANNFNRDKLELFYDYGGVGHFYRFEEMIESKESPYHTLTALRHSFFGTTILLGDDIMSCEDDSPYDLACLKLFERCRCKERVLILGGGDCSMAILLQERMDIRKIDVVEIDREVPEFFMKHFSSRINGRVNLLYQDVIEFSKSCKTNYNVVIDDMTTVPIGTSGDHHRFLSDCFPNSMIISQTDSVVSGEHGRILERIKAFDPSPEVHVAFVPIYMEEWSFTLYRGKNLIERIVQNGNEKETA